MSMGEPEEEEIYYYDRATEETKVQTRGKFRGGMAGRGRGYGRGWGGPHETTDITPVGRPDISLGSVHVRRETKEEEDTQGGGNGTPHSTPDTLQTTNHGMTKEPRGEWR